jgi:uncharacterized membrane protein YccC
MASRSDAPVAVLVLVAAALVLAAPVVGRAGYARAADTAMALAAAAGLLSFVWVAVHTLRAARRVERNVSEDGR